jgi:hypothetical protein
MAADMSLADAVLNLAEVKKVKAEAHFIEVTFHPLCIGAIMFTHRIYSDNSCDVNGAYFCDS